MANKYDPILDAYRQDDSTDISGKVSGPASSTNDAIARFDGTTGKLIQDSSVVIDDTGNVGIGAVPTFEKLLVEDSKDDAFAGLQSVVRNTSTTTQSLAAYAVQANDGASIGIFGVDGLGNNPFNNEAGTFFGSFTNESVNIMVNAQPVGRWATDGSFVPASTIDGRDVAADGTKLDGIESGAEVNNISDANATDLTDGGETTLHTHAGGGYASAETPIGDNTRLFDNPVFKYAEKTTGFAVNYNSLYTVPAGKKVIPLRGHVYNNSGAGIGQIRMGFRYSSTWYPISTNTATLNTATLQSFICQKPLVEAGEELGFNTNTASADDSVRMVVYFLEFDDTSEIQRAILSGSSTTSTAILAGATGKRRHLLNTSSIDLVMSATSGLMLFSNAHNTSTSTRFVPSGATDSVLYTVAPSAAITAPTGATINNFPSPPLLDGDEIKVIHSTTNSTPLNMLLYWEETI